MERRSRIETGLHQALVCSVYVPVEAMVPRSKFGGDSASFFARAWTLLTSSRTAGTVEGRSHFE